MGGKKGFRRPKPSKENELKLTRLNFRFLDTTMEIEGLDNTEYHHNYSHDEENLAFTTAFPSFSYIYANGGTLSFNAAGGMHARNTGGTVKNASESTAITADLNKFLQDEERETASAYLSMRPELQNKIYGRGSSALQGNGGVNSDGLGGSAPKAPFYALPTSFQKYLPCFKQIIL